MTLFSCDRNRKGPMSYNSSGLWFYGMGTAPAVLTTFAIRSKAC